MCSPQELLDRSHAMLLRGGEDRFAKRNRFEVVAAADLRLGGVFHGAQELCHGADECIGEPDFSPPRLQPVARLLLRLEVERERCAGGIAGPTDGAACQAVGSIDAPANEVVVLSSFARGACPNIVPTRGPAAS